MKPRLLVVLSRFPYPLDKGDKLRAFYFIKHLSQTYRIFLFALSDLKVSEHTQNELKPYCEEIHILSLSKARLVWNLLQGLTNNLPFQVNYFLNQQHKQTIQTAIERIKPDKLFCQLPRVAEYIRTIQGIPKTLDYQDCFSKIMEGRAQSGSWPMKWIYAWESNRMRKYEANLFQDFEHHLIISKADLVALPLSEAQKKMVRISSNGIEFEFYKPRQEKKDFEVFFAGNMSYPPNVEAGIYLIERVMPLVWEKLPKAKVALIGTNPTAKIKSLAGDLVEVTGFVDDVREWYAKGRILVAPMIIGAGLQNKLLQAMAMEIPCITTPLANSALGAFPGKQVLVGENPSEIASHILTLLNNEELAAQLAYSGREFVTQNFSWDEAVSYI